MKVALKRCIGVVNDKSPYSDNLGRYIGLEHIKSWTGEIMDSADTAPDGLVSRFRPGDILFGKLRPYLAKVAAPDFNGVCSTEALVLRAGPKILPRFLRYSLSSADFIERVNSATFGAQMPRASWEDMGKERLYLPDLTTQRQIADFLDRETARIDLLIEKKQRMMELLEQRHARELTNAVIRPEGVGIDLVNSGYDWLGEVPSGWRISRIGWELKRMTYGFTNPMPTEDEGPYLLTANDINHGRILWDSARHTSQSAFEHELTDKSRPERGDILLTKDGTLGRVAIHDGREACINQSVALLRPMTKKVCSEYLAAVLQTQPYQDRMVFEAGGTTIKHIYISRLAQMPLPLPPLDVQVAITQRLAKAGEQVASLMESVRQSITRFREYRSVLITAAVTGQIDPATRARAGHTDRQLDAMEAC